MFGGKKKRRRSRPGPAPPVPVLPSSSSLTAQAMKSLTALEQLCAFDYDCCACVKMRKGETTNLRGAPSPTEREAGLGTDKAANCEQFH
jgi:hypothetical protein